MTGLPSPLADPLPEYDDVVVYGLGWTGVAAANLLAAAGKNVRATDTRTPEQLAQALAGLEEKRGIALDPRVEPVHAPHDDLGAPAVVLTQSVKHWEPAAVEPRKRGIAVVPEVELAARALDQSGVHLVAIGGTDGKTTTTKLAGLFGATLGRAWIGGNSWTPLSARILEVAADLEVEPPRQDELLFVVAEVSAFQLPPWHGFRPAVSAVTNIAEDHFEEFFQGDLGAYIAAKRALTDRQQSGDFAVLNQDDPVVRSWIDEVAGRGVTTIPTSLASRAVADRSFAAYRCNGELRLRKDGVELVLLPERDLPLRGDHNVENTLMAAALFLPWLDRDKAAALGLATASFEAPAHRLARVASHDGFDIYDDSKATNVHAALAGLSAFGPRPLVAIIGGVDKGLDLEPLASALASRARLVVVIGELRDRFRAEFADRIADLRTADSLEQAVMVSLSAARPGDVVVLSPACSSFDMFDSYAHRGREFARLVRQHLKG